MHLYNILCYGYRVQQVPIRLPVCVVAKVSNDGNATGGGLFAVDRLLSEELCVCVATCQFMIRYSKVNKVRRKLFFANETSVSLVKCT